MTITFFDIKLNDNDTRIWSPNTWKTRLSLNIKGLEYETKFLTLLEVHERIQEIVPGVPKKLAPVIIHHGKAVQDSFEISKYLDQEFPEPSIHHNQETVHRYFGRYLEGEAIVPLYKIVFLKVYEALDEENKKYYRASRESYFNGTLEEHAGDPEEHIVTLIEKFKPIEGMLRESLWISGSQIGWSDVLTAGWLLYLEALAPDRLQQLLERYPKLTEWWKSM
ncbi:hypothetical protein Unana1_02994 [Umbelopsis nana]